MYKIIGTGVQSRTGTKGGSELMRPLHILLNKIFSNDNEKFIYSNKLDYFGIVIRIAGEVDDFDGEDGPVRLKKSRGEDRIIMDFVVPMKKWQEYMIPIKATKVDKIIRWDIISDEKAYEFREYIANGIIECYSLMKEKAKKLKYKFDETKMDEDFNNGIEVLLKSELPKVLK